MNRFHSYITIITLALLSMSCVREGSELSEVNLVPVTFEAAPESTKTMYSDGDVLWEDSDAISLFSGENYSTKTSLTAASVDEDRLHATFRGLAADASSSYIAVYPSSDANAYSGSALTVNIPSQQTAVAGGFMSGANTSVAVSQDETLTFRNVGALVGVCIGASDAGSSSVTLRTRKAETGFYGLTGSVSVRLDGDIPVAAEGSSDYVTLLAPEGGFKAGSVYYAVVCPGSYNGFELDFIKDGKTVRKSDATSCTLERSSSVKIGPVYTLPGGVPEEVVVNLDFSQGWPFVESCTPEGSQVATGETYTYRYDYQEGEESRTMELEFAFNSGVKQAGTYSYDADTEDGNGRALCYKFGTGTDTGYGYIKFPVINGKYLKSVALVHRTPIPAGATGNNLNGFYFTLQKGGFPSHATPNATSTRVKAGEELVIAFPMNGLVSDLGQYYCMRVRFKDIEFERITLVYSDKKPSHEMELPENSHLYAHRGRWSKDESGSFVIPENSLHGIREAALMGYEGVECDVKCLTKDGKMVMNHDYTLDRTMRKASDYSKVTGEIRLDALTFAEIRNNYVLESSVPEFRIAPPTFEEFLNECKKWKIKPMLHSSYEQAFRLAAEIMGDNWVCFSSNYEKVKAVREYSNCTILWSVDSGTPEEIIEKLEAIGGDCGISSMEYSLYTPEFVSAIRAAGYHVQCSVFSDGEEKNAIENGVDYILSDRIQPVGYDKNGSILDNPKDHIITPEPADTPDVPQPEVPLPDEFTIDVDFTKGWPFKEEPSKTFAAEGEEYTYSYKYDPAKEPMDITFVITTRGRGSYSYFAPADSSDGYLAMPTEAASTNRYGCISIPPIIGRYPKKVELVRNSKGYFVAFGGFPSFSGNTSSQNDPFEFPVTISSNDTWFPAGTASSTPRDYCIGIRFSGTQVKHILITYSKAKPE